MDNSNEFYVYVLLDPRKPGTYKYGEYVFEYEPFYIGKGKGYQINAHDYECKRKNNTRKANKIKSIFENTKSLHLRQKVQTDLYEDPAFELEKFLILQIGRLDNNRGPLTNATDGGEGMANPTQETRDKISRAKKGKPIGPNSPESYIKFSKTMKMKYKTTNMAQIHSEKMKKLYESKEARDLLSERSKQSYKDNPEKATKHSLFMKEYWKDKKKREDRSKQQKEIWKDPEYKKSQTEKYNKRWSKEEERIKTGLKSKEAWKKRKQKLMEQTEEDALI